MSFKHAFLDKFYTDAMALIPMQWYLDFNGSLELNRLNLFSLQSLQKKKSSSVFVLALLNAVFVGGPPSEDLTG